MKIVIYNIIFIFLLINCAPSYKYYVKTVPAPNKYISKIAVIPENWDDYWISSFSYRALITELMDVGFRVIERSNIESIINEQKLQQSGLLKTTEQSNVNIQTYALDKGKIAEIGKILGVDKLVLVYVVPTGRKVHMGTIRLVDVESAIILTSSTFVTKLNGEDTDVIMKQIALDIVSALKKKSRIIHNNLFDSSNLSNTNRKDGDKLLND